MAFHLKTVPMPREALADGCLRTMWQQALTRPDEAVGYGALGMYTLSHALWLLREAQTRGLECINFLARDGWLIRQAFDRVNAALVQPVRSGYVRISRQAVLPLHFTSREDLLRLPQVLPLKRHTPRTALTLLQTVISKEEALCAAGDADLAPDVLLTAETGDRLAQLLADRFYDPARFQAYRAQAECYLTPLFAGRCGTFDVGYNLRSESLIKAVTGADLTAFMTHTDGDLARQRSREYQLPFMCLYDAPPPVSWIVREQFLLEDAPLCESFGPDGPVLRAVRPLRPPAVAQCQAQALRFVDDMVRLHPESLRSAAFSPAAGCLPFEHFLQHASRRQMLPFRLRDMENDFLSGAAGEDSPFLQWRLMQTDVPGKARVLRRLRRAAIRLREEPQSFLQKLRGR